MLKSFLLFITIQSVFISALAGGRDGLEVICNNCEVIPRTDRAMIDGTAKSIQRALDEASSVGTLRFEGKVKVRRGEKIFESPDIPAIQTGDRISVGDGSSASLILKDGTTVQFNPNTDLTIDSYIYTEKGSGISEQLKGVFRLISGLVETKVPSKDGRGNELRIETPTAAIVVRGTKFQTKVVGQGSNTVTTLKTLEGKVEFTNLTTKKSTMVEAGYEATLAKNKFLGPKKFGSKGRGEIVPSRKY